MERHDLSDTLRRLGACHTAVRWAMRYGRDWDAALAASPDPYWVLWLACELSRRGFLPRHAVLKPFAQAVLATVPKWWMRDSAEVHALVVDLIGWCDVGGAQEDAVRLRARLTGLLGRDAYLSVRDLASAHMVMDLFDATTQRGLHFYAALAATVRGLVSSYAVAPQIIHDNLGPYLVPALRAAADAPDKETA